MNWRRIASVTSLVVGLIVAPPHGFAAVSPLKVLGANPEQPADGPQIGGKIWADDTVDLTSKQGHRNGFDVSRAFIEMGYAFDEQWSTRLVLDAVRTTYLNEYLRVAFIQGKYLWAGAGTLRFGIQPTMFIAASETALKTRWLGKTLADQSGFLRSISGGFAASGEVGSVLTYSMMIHNGSESLSQPGVNDNALAYSEQLQITPLLNTPGPFQKLSLNIFDEVQSQSSSVGSKTLQSNVVGLSILLENPRLDFGIESLFKTQKNVDLVSAYGITANPKFRGGRYSFYMRYFSGTEGFEKSLGGKFLYSLGPTLTIVASKVSTALIYDCLSPRSGPQIQSVSWKWAASF